VISSVVISSTDGCDRMPLLKPVPGPALADVQRATAAGMPSSRDMAPRETLAVPEHASERLTL
jgi:hypothetical protein